MLRAHGCGTIEVPGDAVRLALPQVNKIEEGRWSAGAHIEAAARDLSRRWDGTSIEVHRIEVPLPSDAAYAVRVAATDDSGAVV